MPFRCQIKPRQQALLSNLMKNRAQKCQKKPPLIMMIMNLKMIHPRWRTVSLRILMSMLQMETSLKAKKVHPRKMQRSISKNLKKTSLKKLRREQSTVTLMVVASSIKQAVVSLTGNKIMVQKTQLTPITFKCN